MGLINKVGVLLRDPKKLVHYCEYSRSRMFYGEGIARIPSGGRMRTSSFSEYLSVFGLLPGRGELAMIQKRLANAKVAFDLGANVGVWSVLMSRANPQAAIHSFEPNPVTYALLEKNMRQNNCSNVVINLKAVSDKAGQLSFQVPQNASIYGRVAPVTEGVDVEGRFNNAESFMVPAIPMASYCAGKSINEIDFLKIDVEGHELAAFKGMEPMLSEQRIKAIYMETIKENHDRMGTSYSDWLKFTADCGYRFYTVGENGEPEAEVPIDKIEAHNHLCLPK